jgi:large subunit ribosomal protein L47
VEHVKPDQRRHPLDAFFEGGHALPDQLGDKQRIFGRAWSSDELRCKSFEDLHRLWFVLLREVNLLATQRAEARRHQQRWVSLGRLQKCRLSMARLKGVLTERFHLFKTAASMVKGRPSLLSGDPGEAKTLIPPLNSSPPVKTEAQLLVDWQKSEKMRQLWRKRRFRRRINYRKRRNAMFV